MRVEAVSAAARAKIEAAGGTVELIAEATTTESVTNAASTQGFRLHHFAMRRPRIGR